MLRRPDFDDVLSDDTPAVKCFTFVSYINNLQITTNQR